MANSIDISNIKFEYIQSNHFKQEHDCESINPENKSGRAHPDIYKSISVFQAPPRRKLNIGRDNEIKIYKKLLSNESITLDYYVKNLLPLFTFRKNKKSDKEADDSDSSDDDGENALVSESKDFKTVSFFNVLN